MRRVLWIVLGIAFISSQCFGGKLKTIPPKVREAFMDTVKVTGNEIAVITMKDGKQIYIRFYPKEAPNTVKNFIMLTKLGFYDDLIFHRVVPNFVVQGGDPSGTGYGGPGYTIDAEFNDIHHITGTVAMARSQDPNSAGSQFYICLAPQPHLDRKYTVFGQVIHGMDVVKRIVRGDTMKTVRIVSAAELPNILYTPNYKDIWWVSESPKVLKKVMPYTSESVRGVKLKQTHTLRCLVDTTGNVIDVKIVKSTSKSYDEMALESAKQWKFVPIKYKGKKVSAWVSVTMEFPIEEKAPKEK